MEFEGKITIMVMFSFVFSLCLFGVTMYYMFQNQQNDLTLIENYNTLQTAVSNQLTTSNELTTKIEEYLYTTSTQLDTVRTEDNLNFFRIWLLLQKENDREFIEDEARNVNLTCFSSVNGINMNSDIFTMSVTVQIEDVKESRSIRFSRSAATCHYFTMEIPCEELCIRKTGEIEDA